LLNGIGLILLQNVLVSGLQCNGSHGISVGSLGQYAQETDIVANIWAENVKMSNAQNGARIKVFGGNPSPNSTAGGGSGYVRNITFANFQVSNVDYPIYINQCYSTPAATCAQYPSKLSISDVHCMFCFRVLLRAEPDRPDRL
jgi:galacturan 1,4-alpha-galacturonidase